MVRLMNCRTADSVEIYEKFRGLFVILQTLKRRVSTEIMMRSANCKILKRGGTETNSVNFRVRSGNISKKSIPLLIEVFGGNKNCTFAITVSTLKRVPFIGPRK